MGGIALNPVSPWWALLVLGTALIPVWIRVRREPVQSSDDRVASIDGLRGFLAFFVFLHHSALWYYFLRSGRWEDPPSRLYTHLGQASVAMFFMITGFLFLGKVLDGARRPVDWTRLYVGRILRLVPLYVVAMVLMLALVGHASGWTLQEPLPQLLEHVLHWGLFTIADAPPVNAVPETPLMVAGVTWSLAYEWFFYALLPVMAVLLRQRPPALWLGGSAAALAVFAWWGPASYHLLGFAGGMAAALAARSASFRRVACTPRGTLVTVLGIAGAVALFPGTHATIPQLLLGVAFAPIAAGNSLGGLLRQRVARTLGDAAYSVYLLHGTALYVTFTLLLGRERTAALSPAEHWTVVAFLAPILVSLCMITFHWVERPALALTPRVLDVMRRSRPAP